MIAAIDYPSPNHGVRHHGGVIDHIIIHGTAMDTAAAALARLCDPQHQVSAHYLIDEAGNLYRLVDDERRAWHAGTSFWRGWRDLNSRSIGIELANACPQENWLPYPRAQMDALRALLIDLFSRHPVPARHLLGHSDIAPQRKHDPGSIFPWDLLASWDLGHWVKPASIAPGDDLIEPSEQNRFYTLLADYGYECTAEMRQHAIRAFQRHFRPVQVDGILDRSTRATLEALAL